MNFYISDMHLGHRNCIVFENRPFTDADEMDCILIENWNNRVTDEDHVYILGDFCFRSSKSPDWYLKHLKGHKHFVIGNHDQMTLNCENAQKYIESMDKMMHISDEGREICLCHFPIADWNKARHGSWHIYGHIHQSRGDEYQFMVSRERALNAAASINNYTPATFEELLANNKRFQEEEALEEQYMVATNKKTGEVFRVPCGDVDDVFAVRPASIRDRNLPVRQWTELQSHRRD